jgi:hypothetical protein
LACITRWRISGRTWARPFSTRSTVAVPTPASLAISAIFGARVHIGGKITQNITSNYINFLKNSPQEISKKINSARLVYFTCLSDGIQKDLVHSMGVFEPNQWREI